MARKMVVFSILILTACHTRNCSSKNETSMTSSVPVLSQSSLAHVVSLTPSTQDSSCSQSMSAVFNTSPSVFMSTQHSRINLVNSSMSIVSPSAGPYKIYFAEIKVLNLNFSSNHENKSSSDFKEASSVIIMSIDSVMNTNKFYKECKVVEIRSVGKIVKFEITVQEDGGSVSGTELRNLQDAIKSGRVGNLTVDPSYFILSSNSKEGQRTRERLIPGQLAGAALILFILVVLLLIIVLGNFADQPVLNDREIYTEEMRMKNMGISRNNEGQQEDDDWRFDPLFSRSPEKSFDSKL